MTSTVSQSDVIMFLSKHLQSTAATESQKKFVSKAISTYMGVEKAVIHTVLESTLTKTSLEMLKGSSSTLAVVDEEGKLIGNVAAADCKGIFTEHWTYLFSSIKYYLSQ